MIGECTHTRLLRMSMPPACSSRAEHSSEQMPGGEVWTLCTPLVYPGCAGGRRETIKRGMREGSADDW